MQKQFKLEEFHYALLRAVENCGICAYGNPVRQHMEKSLGKVIAFGAFYGAAATLEVQGYISSTQVPSIDPLSNFRKRLFTLTSSGTQALMDGDNVKE